MQSGIEAEYMGSRAQPLPDPAGQLGLHSPHQPVQLQGTNQQPYMQLDLAQGQVQQALAQSQQIHAPCAATCGPNISVSVTAAGATAFKPE